MAEAAAGGRCGGLGRRGCGRWLHTLRPKWSKPLSTLKSVVYTAAVALHIRDPEAGLLAGRLAAMAGETKTAAVIRSLRERLERLEREQASLEPGQQRLADRLNQIALQAAQRPRLDQRSAEAILGYDDHGLPA
ncbi:MAG: type II toxin-antitoxin system VapB family antitoxin [Synechococcus sp.]|nr:type II toxin-antitoxin system VapB family antitoxin [Synechococcus sp.]